MPRPWDPADATKFLTAVTFAGLGGFWTLFYSYWLRDKGAGMAYYMGRLTGPITGKPEAMPDSGALPSNDEGLAHVPALAPLHVLGHRHRRHRQHRSPPC